VVSTSSQTRLDTARSGLPVRGAPWSIVDGGDVVRGSECSAGDTALEERGGEAGSLGDSVAEMAKLLAVIALVAGCKRYDADRFLAVCSDGTGYDAAAAYDPKAVLSP
jgi:hypothetical protein